MNKIKVGDVFTTNNCGECVVTEYISWDKVRVKFITTGYECCSRSDHLRDGKVKDVHYPSICEIGYLGEGAYLSRFNGKCTKEYALWRSMLERCYSTKKQTLYQIRWQRCKGL